LLKRFFCYFIKIFNLKSLPNTILSIFLITAISLSLPVYVSAQYSILWEGTETHSCDPMFVLEGYCTPGSYPVGDYLVTSEIAMTSQAAEELAESFWDAWAITSSSWTVVEKPGGMVDCYFISSNINGPSGSSYACMDGTFEYDISDWSGPFLLFLDEISGTWDVIPDIDGDGISDADDNCPNDENNDADNDGVCGDVDNCPIIANPNQEDADNDTIGDVCDDDTIYGTVSGDIQAGVTVNIYTTTCGSDILEATTETDANGYYAFGGLSSQRYLLAAGETGYSFSSSYWVDIQQTEIQSYDFTATSAP
jgi:hypothetical protein